MNVARLPNTAQASRPWRIHELVPDFRLEDVWALPTPGGPDDFPRLVHGFTSGDLFRTTSPVVGGLFAVRWQLGKLLGWDRPGAGLGARVPTLRDRLPADLRGTPIPSISGVPFTPLYVTHDELAAEIANQTMHGIAHLGWVPDADGRGGYHGQMAVYVKPNGRLGTTYMAAIKPFRHLLVYPALIRSIGRNWPATAPVAAGQRTD